MSSDPVDDTASVSSRGHHSSPSTASIGSQGSNAFADVADVDVDDLPDSSPRACTSVTVQWLSSVKDRIFVYASHDRFAQGTELTGDNENGFSAALMAPVGQDLLYRFSVDGEWQTDEDAPIMQLNGEEFNVISVSDESAAPPATQTQSAGVRFAEPESEEKPDDDDKPKLARRQSSIHWDVQRAKLVISDEKANASPSKTTTAGAASPSPRFVSMTGSRQEVPSSDLPPPATPVQGGDDDNDDASQDGSEDPEDDDTSSQIGSGTRTQRKNRAHRIKLKQRALFQSPPQSLSNSAPVYQTPNGAPRSITTPGHQMLHGMNINALKMEALQRENEWKEAWIAHEIQTFQQREEERKVLKAQMNDERARWLAKLKEYTGELKTVREENLALKTDLAAAGSRKRMESATKARTEKFQTLQKNLLNEEMLQWIKEKAALQAEIESLKAAQATAVTEKEGVAAQVQAQATEVTNLGLAVQSKEREASALADEISSLKEQLSQAAGSGSEASEQLTKAQNKLAEEVRAANTLRGELQTSAAQLTAAQNDLVAKVKEIESFKAAATTSATAATAKEQAHQAEIAALQQKLMAAQDEVFMRTAELEGFQADLEQAQSDLSMAAAQNAARTASLEQQLAAATSASQESKTTIFALASTVKSLRNQVAELAQTTLSHTAAVTKQMAEAQKFLTQALQVQANLLHSTMQKYKKEMSERRKLHNQVQELRGNIRVYARTRPLSEKEQSEAGNAIIVPPADEAGEVSTELILESAKLGKSSSFQFDAVFGPDSTQAGVFSQIVSLVTSVLDGYNVCLFAYGQTGAGKTWTMSGHPSDPGMNLRSLTELFRLRSERSEDFEYNISVQYYEIYNEQIFDLLDTDREKELKIRQASTGVYVEGLVERPVQTQEDVLKLMEEGAQNRSTGKTNMNAHSSRSHSILSVSVHGHSHVTGMAYLGKLHLIDLAGSERIGRTQATGDRLKEAQAINLSLSALGNVIEALQKKQSHVPFRNSKLTHILSNSLGGNAKTLMMVNVSPCSNDVEETNCSLQFASRVRSVELGTVGKNVAAAPPKEPKAAAASDAGESVTSPTSAGTPAKRPTSAAVGAKKPTSATPGAVKKVAPAAGAPTSATKRTVAK